MYKDIVIALISGLSASALGAYVTYAVTLEKVEQPKLELEAKKTLLEAHKQILALSPAVQSSCESERWNNWSWRVTCDSKSASQYPTWVKITNVIVVETQDAGRKSYEEGQAFDVFFPNDKKGFLSTPGSTGSLEFFVTFREKTYPKGLVFDGLVIRPRFEYATVESAKKFLQSTFPEQAALISEVSQTPPILLWVSLNGLVRPQAAAEN